MFSKSLSLIWNNIKKEAIILSKIEPVLASFYYSALLQHKSFNNALNYILANKLADSIIPEITIYKIIKKSYKKDPKIVISASYDILAIKQRDPVVNKYSTPLLYLKGFHALQAYRISNWLWKNKRYTLAEYLQNKISTIFAVDIHPAAKIGHGIMLDHATSIVIGETSIIENNVSILQSVTLGGTGKSKGDRHPKIREGVMIGAGAKILGNIEIGKNAKIGAGSVVLCSIPPNTTATGVPAKIINKKNKLNFNTKKEKLFNDIIYGLDFGAGI